MSNRFAVRRLRDSDLDRILEIERDSFGKDAYDRNLFAAYRRKCGELFLVAERGASLWGYLVACMRGENRGTELVSIAVDPAIRGKGAGSALIDSLIRRLRRRGVDRLNLMVKVTNEAAIRFYRGHGFRRVRLVGGYYEDGADGILMQREL